MSFIRTVNGDIPPDELGVCYAHEHIIIDPSYTTEKYPEFELDSVAKAVAGLRRFHELGGRALVDSMPCASGRNAVKLAAVSKEAGVHILCPTGLHLGIYYPHGHWSERISVDALAELFIADIEQGIDENDYNGPVCARTKHRAGLIKVAGGLDALNEREARAFKAAAIAHCKTGAPILTHTEKGTAALEQAKLLRDNGVDLQHVVLSHTDRKPELEYHKEILGTGVRVEYDAHFRWKEPQGNPTLDLIVELFKCGFGAQIMLGMDAARRSYWDSYDGRPGMGYLLGEFSDRLSAAGLSDTDLHGIFVQTPAWAYRFANVGKGA